MAYVSNIKRGEIIMNENKLEIKNKIIEIINFARTNSAFDTEKKILSVLHDDIRIMSEKKNSTYYQEETTRFKIKEMNGLEITITKGDLDRYGETVSHIGTDVYLSSPLSNNEDMAIFIEDKFQDINENVMIDDFIDFKVTEEQLLQSLSQNNDFDLLNTLDDSISFSSSFAKELYQQMEEAAKTEKENQEYESDISLQGGDEIYIHDVPDILYEQIKKIKPFLEKFDLYENTKNLYLSIPENIQYLDNEIIRNEKMLYFIDHEDQYQLNYKLDQYLRRLNDIPNYDETHHFDSHSFVSEELKKNKVPLKYDYNYLFKDAGYNYFDLNDPESFDKSFVKLEENQNKIVDDLIKLKDFRFSDLQIDTELDHMEKRNISKNSAFYLSLSHELQNENNNIKSTIDKIQIEAKLRYTRDLMKSYPNSVGSYEQHYLSSLRKFKDTPLYAHAINDFVHTKVGRLYLRERMDEISDYKSILSSDQFKAFEEDYLQLDSLRNQRKNLYTDYNNAYKKLDEICDKLSDLNKKKFHFWNFKSKQLHQIEVNRTNCKYMETEKMISNINEDLDQIERKENEFRLMYQDLKNRINDISDFKCFDQSKIFSKFRQYEDYFNQEQKEMKEIYSYSPYKKKLDIDVNIKSKSIIDFDSEKLNQTLTKILKEPYTYDAMINFKIDDSVILNKSLIDENDLNQISSDLSANKKTAFFSLVRNLLDDDESYSQKMNKINIHEENFIKTHEENIPIDIDTVLSPVM